MKRITFVSLIVLLVSLNSMAQDIEGRFAIQNTQTGKNLRPYDANSANGTRIVLYNHVEWKCMTWDFIKVEKNVYQLKNRFTNKTIQPSDRVAEGVKLVQQPLAADTLQYWVFEKTPENTYFIRLKGTDLYISLSSKETNTDIVLKSKKDKPMQTWKLIAQDPVN